jgi:hypothetical protein
MPLCGFNQLAGLLLVLAFITTRAYHDISFIEQKYTVCIITRVKIMHPVFLCNLMEWIEYHHQLGMSQIFIVDDCSPITAVQEVLRYYRRRGVVTPFRNVGRHQDGCATKVPDEQRLGHLMFQRHAKHMCAWVTYLDMDEFLTAWNVTGFSLEKVLQEHAVPFFRLPWWIVGSDTHETRPNALVIDAYKGGRLERLAVKTMAKSSECLDYSFTHYPYVARPKEIVFNMTLQAFVEQHKAHQFEIRTMNSADTVIHVPATSMFVKHYMYLSWQEFQSQRANFTYNSAGERTIWAEDPRAKWLGGIIKPPVEIAQEFTSDMSARVLASFRNERTHGRLPFSFCHAIWNLR